MAYQVVHYLINEDIYQKLDIHLVGYHCLLLCDPTKSGFDCYFYSFLHKSIYRYIAIHKDRFTYMPCHLSMYDNSVI